MSTNEERKDKHQQNAYGNRVFEEALSVYKKYLLKETSTYEEKAALVKFDEQSSDYDLLSMRIDAMNQVQKESNDDLSWEIDQLESARELLIEVEQSEFIDEEALEKIKTVLEISYLAEEDYFQNPLVTEKQDMEYTIADIKSESYKILFKEIQKKYPSVAVLNINGNELMLDFFGKTNYSYNPDDGLVSESSVISSFGRGTVNRTSVIEEIYQSMEESGHIFQRAMNLGIELDEAFNFDELKQLFQKSTTEKELYSNISSIRSEVELEWSFSEVKTSKEIDSYRKENQQKLNEELKKGAIYFVNGDGTEYQVDSKRKLIGETKSNEDTKVVKVDNIFEFMKDKGAVACSAEAMEETKKNQIKLHQSERTNNQEKNQQQVVAAKRTNEGRSF